MHLLNRLQSAIHHKVRYKLLLLVLFPILLIMPLALALAVYWGKNFTYDQLFLKVNTDLAVSHDAFSRIRQDYLNQLERLAGSYAFRSALGSGNRKALIAQVDALQKQAGYSFLNVIDTQNRESLLIGRRSSSTLINALNGKASVGIEIFSASDLAKIDPDLKKRVELPLVKTPRARPSNRTLEDRAMLIRAIFPVKDSRGKLVALLDGGVLLNENFKFVDAIRDLAYGPGSLPKDSIGTVTVFLDDVRISTNVPLKKGERALGTRVSDEVRTKVLDNGATWIDRAFVVNDWYVSSYEPIVDVDGKRVGMLYAGFLEKPFREALWRALGVLILLFIGLMLLSAWAAIRASRSIIKPIERMSEVVQATQKGGAKRVGHVQSKDELGALAREFDAMLDQLQQRNQEIQNWADSLEDKVESRTAELKEKNQDLKNSIQLLRQTRQQLVVAEKLAALGELTAGVAHEVNNPTAVMLGNLDLIVAELGDKAAPVQDEINLVIEQIYRIKDIINRLLQYAHPDEYSGYITQTDVNILVKDTLKLVNHLRDESKFKITTQLNATLLVEINPQELQQVIINLLVNAIHALPDTQGLILIQTENWNDKGVVVSIVDNGKGIDDQLLDQIFNPFFSTKEQGEGTGLGLSISYGLMRRYGGNITAESELGKGSAFKVWILSEPKIMADEEAIVEQLKDIEEGAATV